MTDTLEQRLRHYYDQRTADLPTVGPGLPTAPVVGLTERATPRRPAFTGLLAAAAVAVAAVGGVVVLSARADDGAISTADRDRTPPTTGSSDNPGAAQANPATLQPAATLPVGPDVSDTPITADADQATDWYRLAPDLDVAWYQSAGVDSPPIFCWRTPVMPAGACFAETKGTAVVPLVVPTSGSQTLVVADGDGSNAMVEITLDDGSQLAAPQDFDDQLNWGIARFVVAADREIVAVGGIDLPTVASAPASTLVNSPPSSVVGPRISEPKLDDVVPDSIPMVIIEYLAQLSQDVCADVGPEMCGNAEFENPDSSDVSVTIYGTDADVITRSVDRLCAPEFRDRVTVVETKYSTTELETLGAEAQNRLDAAGVPGMAWVQSGLDHLIVTLYTDDGLPNDELVKKAKDALGEIPATFDFSVPLSGD